LPIEVHLMTLTTRTLPSHIVFDEQGRAWLDGTGRKVVEIAIDNRAGLSAAQIHAAHPDLPLAKIHAALAYYYDHQAELDSEIERLDRYVEQVQSRHPNRVTRQELEDRLKQGSQK
jgi:uncharacterized protein (DUF433 family)